jgi:hypothetical protein
VLILILKDCLKCECGGIMFPSKFDENNKKISYKCVKCGIEKEYDFSEAELLENDKYTYFCLNDKGLVTWKCFSCGYCDNKIENLISDFKNYDKFITTGCYFCKDVDDEAGRG